ncbi:hypothetical protein GCM10022406_41340 [Hymenobacter algoricola]|uniref:Uncharacterized protein n=1 Tax=Hymenobacter algoricola TaxID=486267 RepID=A0ABP7NWQ6_9BACT
MLWAGAGVGTWARAARPARVSVSRKREERKRIEKSGKCWWKSPEIVGERPEVVGECPEVVGECPEVVGESPGTVVGSPGIVGIDQAVMAASGVREVEASRGASV